MKKTYSKPDILFDSFAMAESIASCEVKANFQSGTCGVVMTEAGATYPYGVDPHDSMIRIAPSLPPIEELEKAMNVFCTCLKLAALEKYLGLTLEQVTER